MTLQRLSGRAGPGDAAAASPPLSDDEAGQVRSAIAAVADRAAQQLRQAGDAWRAVAFVASVHASVDRVVSDWPPGDAAPQCSPGCAHCCEALVEVSDPEALHIARHVRTLPADRQQQAVQALRQQAALRAGQAPGSPLRCAFLDGALCSIYLHRPASCRKAHSLSVQACASKDSSIPQNFVVALRCDTIVAGANQGFQQAGLPAGRNELAAAVLAALLHPGLAAEAWFGGQALLQATPPAHGSGTPDSKPAP